MLNNPLSYNDPSGEIFSVLVGGVIGVLANGINNANNGQGFFNGGLQAAWYGMVDGVMRRNIGGITSSLVGNGTISAITSFFLQTGGHALAGGAIAHAQGGKFATGFYVGAASSVVASLVGLAMVNVSNQGVVGVVQIGSGALAGGAASVLAGGNFWDGVQQGFITAALNHFAHGVMSKIQQNRMINALNEAGIDPTGIPNMSVEEICMLIEKVPVLAELFDSGGEPFFEIKDLGGDYGMYDNPSKTAYIAPKAFTSNLSLAFTVGHELVHATHFHSGLYRRLLRRSSNGVAVRNYSEVLAWRWGHNGVIQGLQDKSENTLKA